MEQVEFHVTVLILNIRHIVTEYLLIIKNKKLVKITSEGPS